MYNHGWYKVGFERDFTSELNPISVGPKRLVAIKSENGIRVIDANCPHRGAHLAYGGTLDCEAVICPFHRYKISFGGDAKGDYTVREYKTMTVSGIVFARLSDSHDNGFPEFIKALADSHTIHPGFLMNIRCARPEMIIENGFDYTHFRPVHGVDAEPFSPEVTDEGNLRVISHFLIKLIRPFDGKPAGSIIKTPAQMNAFSPYLSVAQIKGRSAMTFITSVNPQDDCTTLLRFSLGLPKGVYGPNPPPQMVQQMLKGNRSGIQDDQVIWEQMSLTAPRNFTTQDKAVLAFQGFCKSFY